MIVVSSLLALAVSAAAPDTTVLARVDEVEITADALARRAQRLRGEGKRASTEDILESLVDEVLLAAEARRMGLAGSPEVKARVDAEKRRQAAELFLADRVEKQFRVTDAQLREMFHSTADFAFFESGTFATGEAAAAAVGRIRDGATFAEAVKSAPVSAVYPSPESVPATMRAQLDPALAAALFAAAPRAIVGPVQTQLGFVVARLLRKEIGGEDQFAARREQLRAFARKQFEGSMRAEASKHLRETSHVQLDEKFLGSVGTPPTKAELDHVIATVNGRPVRYREVYDTLRAVGAASGHLSGPSTRIGLAWKEVEKRLLQDYAVEKGFDRSPEIAARAPEIEREGLALAAIDRLRAATPTASTAEAQAFYARNRIGYGRATFEQVRADATARATEEKQVNAVGARVAALRSAARISIDRAALAQAGI